MWVQVQEQPAQLHFNYTESNLKLQNSDVRKTIATQMNPNLQLRCVSPLLSAFRKDFEHKHTNTNKEGV